MRHRSPGFIPISILLLVPILTLACGGESDGPGEDRLRGKHPALADFEEVALDAGGKVTTSAPEVLVSRLRSAAKAGAGAEPGAGLTIDYPLDESLFPPEFVPPTFLWHDKSESADTWLVEFEFPGAEPISVLVPGAPPPRGKVDMEAFSETNRPYEGTDYQNSAKSWTPSAPVWEAIKSRAVESFATVRFTGFDSKVLAAPLSRGSIRISTSKDPVGAPIFYRDVPLMPAVGEHGRVKPLGEKAIPLIAWRLKDVSRPDSKLVLTGMSACGNCHSFSLDGRTLGMDVDGPDGDKGMYAIKPVSKAMVIDYDDVITWNSFTGKPKGHRTIGFMSRVSPDGQYVATTVNESLYVANFTEYRFLQVFYPTRGILAFYSQADGKIHALPGADDADFVHCSPSWTPDGSQIVFSRAKGFEPYSEGQEMAKYPNDPNEPEMRYDLYRIPFNGGKGGEAVPVEGASANGMSNTFPKVSPDGRWIVYTKCKNGLLMRPDSRLWIVPFEGGKARELRCNTKLMNSWHSWSPNGRWLVFSSKSNTPYTQAFLTHIDEDGNDSPAILVPNCTTANRAVNLPEFLNASYDTLDTIAVPVVRHHVHYLQGERYLKAGQYEEAIASMKLALELEPTFSQAQSGIAYGFAMLGRFGDAIPAFKRAIEMGADNILNFTNLGFAYHAVGRMEEALDAFDQALEKFSGFPLAHTGKAAAYVGLGRTDDAIASYLKAIELDQTNATLHRNLSDVYRNAGRHRDAVEHLGLAVEIDPDDPVPTVNLAWALATHPDPAVRDGKRAITVAERAVDLTGGKRPEPFDVLAAAFAEAGHFEDAVRAAERAIKLAMKTAPGLADQIEVRKKLYLERKPYRQPQ